MKEADSKPEMVSADVVALYGDLEKLGIRIWIDGGWGVDALLGEQTRSHTDLDIATEWKDVPELRRFLATRGYAQVREASQWNFVLGEEGGREIDVHAFIYDDKGNVVEGIMYPAASLTGSGTIGGHAVRCISPEYMVKFHSGYELKEKDFQDVRALCEKFAIELPEEYARFSS